MTKKTVIELIEELNEAYPEAKCSLNFETPFQLAIAVMLSAQCTDERVNKTTQKLFEKYKTAQHFVQAPLDEIEELIRPCGFHKTKSRNIKKLAEIILSNYNGTLPSTMEELMNLPGIGRKSANVIMLDAFSNPQGIAVDTHVKRISNRIGLSDNKDPEKIEQDLLKLIPHNYLKDVNHLFIWHGRNTCRAQSPNCENCPISRMCKKRLR